MPKGKIECPICKGSGRLQEPLNLPKNLRDERVKIAHALKEKGYSHREIMRLLNYKSTLSVTLLLKTNPSSPNTTNHGK